MASGSVFVIISCQGVSDAIRDAVDSAQFSEARSLAYKANALSRKLASQVQEKGGSLVVFIQERQVLEVPVSVAEDMPSYLEPYVQELPGMIAVGMGLTFGEAVIAMKASLVSGEIEMYDPKDPRFDRSNEYAKADAGQVGEQPFQLPVNMFDVTVPEEDAIPNQEGFVNRPGADEELQAQSMLVQALAQVMSGGAQQQQQPQEGPRDLREALEGGQVDGYQPQQEDVSGKGSKKSDKGAEPKDKGSKKDSYDEEPEEGEGADVEKRLARILTGVKSSLPQIMALHDKNPDAYKAAMALIQKLATVAKERRVKKAEEITDELAKAIRLRLPVGSRKGNKRKVIVGGKEVWRSMAAGQVQDPQGQPVSVKSHNAKANSGQG